MLSKPLVKALNKQVNLEFYSSNLYLQMSAWCAFKGLPGCAAFLAAQAAEETQHMRKLFDYVNETGALALLGAIEAPPEDYGSVERIFKQTYEHEREVTRHINKLVEAALAEKDYATFNFLQWYVAEQHEEESQAQAILDKLKITGTDGRGLFFFDREIAGMGKRGA